MISTNTKDTFLLDIVRMSSTANIISILKVNGKTSTLR